MGQTCPPRGSWAVDFMTQPVEVPSEEQAPGGGETPLYQDSQVLRATQPCISGWQGPNHFSSVNLVFCTF